MKNVLFGDEAREKLKKGVDLIANAIKVTLGPRGRNMIYGFHYGYPVCTKDGATAARQVESKDPAEQLGLLLVRQVAQKTADDAGDGTTTATLLTQEIFSEGLKSLRTGANPILINRGIKVAVEEALEYIDEMRIPIESEEDIIKVASLSANNDRAIGELINEAVQKVGLDGVITLEDNYQGDKTYVDVIEGMQLNEGLLSPYFITDPVKMDASYQNASLIIIDDDVLNIVQIKKILEEAIGTGNPVILMVNNIHGTVLQNLIQAKMKNNFAIAVIKNPYFGEFRTEQLVDLAALTGASVLGPTTGLKSEKATLGNLGKCDSIKITRNATTIISNSQETIPEVEGRVQMIKDMIEASESDYEKEKLQERLSKLTSGVAVIKVGAPTEVEQKEKKMRIEDALLATRAAIDEGIVPGGGLTLLRISSFIGEEDGVTEEETIGRRILRRAFLSPIKQIAANAGKDGSEIIAIIPDGDDPKNDSSKIGYDFLTNEYGNLIELGVVDPVKVVKASIINAASVAGILLTTEVLCNEEEEEQPETRTPKPKSQ